MSKQNDLQEDIINKTVDFYQKWRFGYLNLAMRMGKCRISIEVLKQLYSKEPNILIAYPDNKLKQTWIDECSLWEYENPNIVHVNYSSLKKHKDKAYDVFICDEFHSLSLNEAELAASIYADRHLFLSGTVSAETKTKWPEFKEIAQFSTLSGIEEGILSDYEIKVHLVDLDNIAKTPNKKGKLVTEKQKYDAYSWVINRNRQQGLQTMHLALARNRLSLSSIGKIEYTKKLLRSLSDKRVLIFTGLADVADKFGHSYHSKSSDDSHYECFMNKTINWLALAAMGKVGVTYPDLDSVILLNFTYNAEESSQILNRAIKLDYYGKIADLHVICLNEPAEIKKVKESLSMLDPNKIKYV